MILYSIVNMYYSGLSAGIQVQHSTAELFNKYRDPSSNEYEMLYDWANNTKVSRVIRGGTHDNMLEFLESLKETDLVFAEFYEIANNNSLSSISFVVTSEMAEFISSLRNKTSTIMDAYRLQEQYNLNFLKAEQLLPYIASRPSCT